MGKEPAPMLADYGALIAEGQVHVLEEGGEAVALIVIYPKDDALFIENIAVDLAAQGNGHSLVFFEKPIKDPAELSADMSYPISNCSRCRTNGLWTGAVSLSRPV